MPSRLVGNCALNPIVNDKKEKTSEERYQTRSSTGNLSFVITRRIISKERRIVSEIRTIFLFTILFDSTAVLSYVVTFQNCRE